jgi:hypothetical protein
MLLESLDAEHLGADWQLHFGESRGHAVYGVHLVGCADIVTTEFVCWEGC